MNQSAGEQLALARQALGLSVEDIAKATRIRRDYLYAIEAMDLRDLPQRTYVNGFVRTYAKAVQLDPNEILEAFNAQTAPEGNAALSRPRLSLVGPGHLRPWVIGGALAAVGLVVIWSGFSRPRPTDINAVAPVPAALYAWVNAEPGSPEGARAMAALAVAEAPRLILRARVTTFIEVREPSGQRIYSGPLRRGERYTLPAVPGVEVSARNGGAVEVLDRQSVVSRLGEPGVPVTGWRADGVVSLDDDPAGADAQTQPAG